MAVFLNLLMFILNLSIWLWILLSVTWECAGDVCAKLAANGHTRWWWLGALISYNLTMGAWLKAVQSAKNITLPGVIWLLCGEFALVMVGWGFFGEALSFYQWLGVFFACLAMTFLCL
jgi:multidrug transporter EmrE-like cation transporter